MVLRGHPGKALGSGRRGADERSVGTSGAEPGVSLAQQKDNAAGAGIVTAARQVVLAALLLLLPAPMAAQRLVGGVRTEALDAPVIGAEVQVRRVGAAVRLTARTDSLGMFSVRLPEGGSYTVEVRAEGYMEYQSAPVEVGPAETVTLEIRMGRNVIPLEPIRVAARTTDLRLAGFHERRLSGAFGRFLTRADIERHVPPRSTELLRGMSGVTLTAVRRGRVAQTGNLISMRGGIASCQPAIYIDGQRVRQSAESTIDDILSPQDIEGVEVYTMGGTAPVQFADPGACGVILFWTRPGGSDGERFAWRRLGLGLAAVVVLGLLLFGR
jgi:hypothetical protein